MRQSSFVFIQVDTVAESCVQERLQILKLTFDFVEVVLKLLKLFLLFFREFFLILRSCVFIDFYQTLPNEKFEGVTHGFFNHGACVL